MHIRLIRFEILPMLKYTICPYSHQAHLFQVTLDIPKPNIEGQIIHLPAWIPGSYMIRDFARNIIHISAKSAQKQLTINKIDKQTWQIEATSNAIQIKYQVYALDLSVRSAWLDTERGYFNGCSVFLAVNGQQDQPCQLDIIPPEAPHQWKVATSLPKINAPLWGFGLYQATDYQHLIDCPVEMAHFQVLTFKVNQIPHYMVISGQHQCDEARFIKDLKRICQQQIKLFKGDLPLSSYLFLLLVVNEGYGGLEHLDSTSLIANRDDLPLSSLGKADEAYIRLLGLCSHEYFHLWNIKRIKPRVLIQPDLSQEVYTPLLWAFEGITSYYDDLALVRSGCICPKAYLTLMAKTITRVLQGRGRLKQSIAESSFDAWTRFYKQDENAPNAIVSYYAKGMLVAFGLDLLLREHGSTLDELMHQLWLQYGKINKGIENKTIQILAEKLTQQDLSDFFQKAVYGTQDLPLEDWFKKLGIKMTLTVAKDSTDQGGYSKPKKVLSRPIKADLGAKIIEKEGKVIIKTTFDQGAAQLAGLTSGDEIVAVNGIRINAKTLESQLNRYPIKTKVKLIIFRNGELVEPILTLLPAQKNCCYLYLKAKSKCSKQQRQWRKQWLHLQKK